MSSMNTFFPSSQGFPPPPPNGRVIIVTRTKNRPVLLARAFASLLSQTYENWHLYLVNDGGDPAPVERLVDQYRPAFKDRITVRHHEHSLGMEAASNAGLKDAEGEYVIIHDDDDSWKPGFLAKTVAFLEEPAHGGVVAVATNCDLVHETLDADEVIEKARFPYPLWKDQVDLRDLLKINYLPPICTLIRKQAMEMAGPYNEYLPVLGDWDYNLRLLSIGDIGTINDRLANYHHRVEGKADDAYTNSVIGVNSAHPTFQVLYRNSMIRQLLRRDPGYAGLLHVLLKEIDQISGAGGKQSDLEQLKQQQDEILAILHSVNQLLRPVRWLWKKLFPVRRLIARLRGRA